MNPDAEACDHFSSRLIQPMAMLIDVLCILQSYSSDGSVLVDGDSQEASLEGVLSAVLQLQVEKSERDGFFSLACTLPTPTSLADITPEWLTSALAQRHPGSC